MQTPSKSTSPRVGVSSCLLGNEVRFDGGHKKDPFITDQLGARFDWVPLCPEMGIGLGTPRETLRLDKSSGETRLIAPRSGTDLTERMEEYAHRSVARLRALDLSGFILKNRSPSCGMERVREYSGSMVTKTGVGVFARVLLEQMPQLPVEEEGRLHDSRLRENFIERVYAYRRVKDLFDGAWRMGDLVAFHSREKYLLLAHDPETYRTLGRLVARASGRPRSEVAQEYQEAFLNALAKPVTAPRHVNVLQHILGFLRNHLDAQARRQLLDSIEDFRASFVPLVVPVTMLRHHAELAELSYITSQTYLNPHPKELRLRTYVG